MARKLRLQYEGAIYHVSVRGNGRRRIFLEDANRERFLWRLGESKEQYAVRIYLYCLMDNHFHLLVETPRANISSFMQSLLTGYTVYFNLRQRHSGHLVQGRYKAPLVEGDTYLHRLSRYIHLNPVHTREAKDWTVQQKRQRLRAYRWSSYREYLDGTRKSEIVDQAPILAMMGGSKEQRRRKYRRFVESGLTTDDEELVELLKEAPRGIGTREFRNWVDDEYERLRDQQGSVEDVSFRREAVLKDKEGIIKVVADRFGVPESDMCRRLRGSPARPVAVWMLCKHAGLTQRAAGKMLGYETGSAVSHQIAKLRKSVTEDAKTKQTMQRIERQIMRLD